MAEKGLFFNARPDQTSVTGYDRNYNADDISDWLSIVCETGVVKDGLKIEASTDLSINVNVGKATIRGKGYINDTIKSFTLNANGTSSNRYDIVVLKLDNNVSERRTYLDIKSVTSIPNISDLERNTSVYEIMLGYVVVSPNATTINQVVDKRGDKELCPWFTAVKGYDEYYDAIVERFEDTVTLTSASATVISTISSKLYNEKYSLVEVFTNGLKEQQDAYDISISGGYIVINFTTQKSSGAKINVVLNKFIDGEGMGTALDQYTALLNDVANLKSSGEYDYICNGTNDNVIISNLVKAYLQGSADYGTMKLNVIGTIGMVAAVRGDGSTASPYGWFDFDQEATRRVIVDFSRCSQINPVIASGTYNVIFHSNNGIEVIGATVVASNTSADTVIRIMSATSGVIKFEKCRFYITAYKNSLIAVRGTFTNCRGSIANVTANSYCFMGQNENSVIKVIGGEYYAYVGDTSYQSAVIGQSGANAVSIFYGVSCPTLARSGFYQTNSLLQWTGGGILCCTDLISALPMIVVSGISNIRGTIALSKANVW